MTEAGDVSGADAPSAPVSPADRDRVVQELTRHFTEDRLSDTVLEARLDRVYHASTLAELNAIVADLSAPPPPARAPASREVVARRVDTAAIPVPRRFTALLSGREQAITGVVPERIRVRARLGYIELDLSGAIFEPGVTRINLRAMMGYVKVILPAGVRVESEGHSLFGYFAVNGQAASDPASRRIVHITGRTLLGFAECQVGSVLPDAERTLPPSDE
jgi:hypothetical protein